MPPVSTRRLILGVDRGDRPGHLRGELDAIRVLAGICSGAVIGGAGIVLSPMYRPRRGGQHARKSARRNRRIALFMICSWAALPREGIG
jgi:hypothetical protein